MVGADDARDAPASQIEPQPPGWVSVALEEYRAHREEVLANQHGQQQSLTLGAAAIGILAAGAFNVWDDRVVASIVFLGAVPLLAMGVLLLWAGEVLGMMRVGAYLERLERELRAAHPDAPAGILDWERSLGEPEQSVRWWRPQYAWRDFGAVMVFVLIALGSIVLGTYRSWDGHEWIAAVGLAIGLAVVALAWKLARDLGQARDKAKKRLASVDARRAADA